MRFRQIHLDFHTCGELKDIGTRFKKEQFQQALLTGHVNSINLFAKCHHGYSYYPSKVNEIHPGLKFDLLTEMVSAAKEINVASQIYISVGFDEKEAVIHPEWLIRNKDESTYRTADFFHAGYHELCLNSGYRKKLEDTVREVLMIYHPEGIWLDITGVRACYCRNCVNQALHLGIDITDANAMQTVWEATYKSYQEAIQKIRDEVSPKTKIFHNSGHFVRGREDLWKADDHYELESLPTGGWSYDHFPISARYIQPFGKDFLGMTGKFHTSWGEFGGFKHPNALRYEAALNLMNGAKCCVGDQMDPNGEMDLTTYQLIGAAYKEVEQKEQWCDEVTSVADIGLFSAEVIEGTKMMTEFNNLSDAGAARILLEGHYLFDVIDDSSDFSNYKLIILPDKIRVNDRLKSKITEYLNQGGKIVATGESGMRQDSNEFALDLGITYLSENEYQPAYIHPEEDLYSLSTSSFVFYEKSHVVKSLEGKVTAKLERPYYNRTPRNFCSHQHFPTSHIQVGDGVIFHQNSCYVAWCLFKDYAVKGSIAYKEIILQILNEMLEGSKTLSTSLPVQGMCSLMKQKDEKRYIQHAVYAVPVMRGKNINIIEDIVPVYDIKVQLRIPERVRDVYLAPQNTRLSFEQKNDQISYTIPKIDCHQMVVIDYD